jgi:hypothetical protein
MNEFGAGKGPLPRPVDGDTFRNNFGAIDFSSLRDKHIEAKPAHTRKEVLNLRLRTLANWCEKRASGDHDTGTTITMLKAKVAELEAAVQKAQT